MPDCDCVITIRSRLAQNRLEGSRPGVGQARPPVVFHGATPSRRVGWLRRSRTRAPRPPAPTRPNGTRCGRAQRQLADSLAHRPTSRRPLAWSSGSTPPATLRASSRVRRRRTPRPPQPASAARRTSPACAAADTASPTPAAAPSKPSCGHWARAPAACSSLENPSTEDEVVARTSRPENQRPRSSTTPGGSSRPRLCRRRLLRQYPAMPHDP
jgi:hypothetical protein